MTPTHLPGRVAIPALPEQSRTPPPPASLERFNSASPGDVVPLLLSCLGSLRWAHRVADHRPYPTMDALLAASDEAAYDLNQQDLAEALAEEFLPSLPEDAYEAAHMALGAAHAAYEAKFGHMFVICLDGVPPNEVLDYVLEAIRSRLANDRDDERVVTAEEVRRLARQRLAAQLGTPGTARPATSHP
ncbi:2-oxo-4-hydroxy-4-carboxy-5-ureidoimidazoline decarboxylase [Streptomyces sp. NBC_00289]|uniref:2-oxo-4-hydroxy-4-carboxy-5-ureidoimidazoline decarboxylase n=1 Tax=Streptomyces sp. NBC_00289 TaxID=2975703 RepID=UPI00324AEEE6